MKPASAGQAGCGKTMEDRVKHTLKLTASGLALGLALALAGCGEEKKQEQAADSSATTTASSPAPAPAPAETQEAAATPTAPSGGKQLTIVSWGGAYQESQRKAYYEPYMAEK